MVLYECKTCNFSSNLKSNYLRHLNSKKHQRNITTKGAEGKKGIKKEYFGPQMTTNDHNLTTNDHKRPQNIPANLAEKSPNYGVKKFRCDLCNKELSTKGHLTRHKKNFCLEKKKKDETSILKNLLIQQSETFERERKLLYKQIEKLLDKVGDTTINNTQTNNIQLNSYGKEDLSHITDSLKQNLIKKPYGMIPRLIEEVHFSEKKPENKNIAISNKKDNKIQVFTGTKWIYKNKDETINDLMDGKYFILDSFYQNNIDSSDGGSYEKFRTYYDDQDKILIDKLKKDCELVLLNNR